MFEDRGVGGCGSWMHREKGGAVCDQAEWRRGWVFGEDDYPEYQLGIIILSWCD